MKKNREEVTASTQAANERQFKPEDYPFYEPGRPLNHAKYHQVSYLDELEATWGKKWGAQGLGKLREVAAIKPTKWDFHPVFRMDPQFFLTRQGDPFRTTEVDLQKVKECHSNLVRVLESEGVQVHYYKYPEPPVGAYGLIKRTMTPAFRVVNGGAIINREATPYTRGREPHMTKFLANLGCPILYTVHGTGICCSAFREIADDAVLVFESTDCNSEALEKIRPILERSGYKEIVVAHCPGFYETINEDILFSMHADMWFLAVDIRVALIYPPYCDYAIIRWFEKHDFDLIEIPRDEHLRYWPANGICLEAGKKVIICKGADKVKKELEKRNIEVIELDYREAFAYGGGMSCSIRPLVREAGPKLFGD